MMRLAVIFLVLLSVPAQAGELCRDVTNPTRPLTAKERLTQIIRPGVEDWLFAGRDLVPAPEIDGESVARLARLASAFRERGISLLVVSIPGRALFVPEKLAPETLADWPHDLAELRREHDHRLAQLRRASILAPDLLEGMKGEAAFQFRRDNHWTPAGAEKAAELVASAYPFPPQQEFFTRITGTKPFTGAYARIVAETCGVSFPGEQIELRETRPRQQNTDLLGERSSAVVLAGTSYSTGGGRDAFNFGGALREKLSTDILDVSVDGGGAEAALLSWLSDDGVARDRPGLVIWEMPEIYSLNLPDFYRQVLPAVNGRCEAVVEDTVRLAGDIVVLDIPEGEEVKAGEDYLQLETDNLGLTGFVLEMNYTDGGTDRLTLRHSTRAANSGRFFAELVRSGQLKQVRLVPEEGAAQGRMTVRLCQTGIR